ncbi:MAG: tetratricopeptide repeat protein [Hyphomicrobium sp.]
MISKRLAPLACLLAGAMTLVGGSVVVAAEAVSFKSAKDALNQGVSAYSGGYYEMAVPALKFASSGREVMADYYLARIYSDNGASFTNHPAAYDLFRRIADEFADVDPDDDPRAPFVGRSLTALAGYMLRGLPEIGLKPNPAIAADYLYNASTIFNDDDAQFELAKLQLRGEGVARDVPLGKHWLATLSQKGHAGAQAFLADLLWRGLYMDANQPRALALITVAVTNAPPQDRLWIEDIHQNIYCGSPAGVRQEADGMVAGWGDRYTVTRKPEAADRSGLGPLSGQPVRTCENGEPVIAIEVPRSAARDLALDPMSVSPQPGSGFMRGGTTFPSLRDVGTQGQ